MSNTEFVHRDYRIIHTTDPKEIGQTKDSYGFPVTQGWIIRDSFDENPVPAPTTWFYTPFDAVAAVEIIDAMRADHSPFPSFNAAYYGAAQLRVHFWLVFAALRSIEARCREALPFDEDGLAKWVLDDLHRMKTGASMVGYPAPTK